MHWQRPLLVDQEQGGDIPQDSQRGLEVPQIHVVIGERLHQEAANKETGGSNEFVRCASAPLDEEVPGKVIIYVITSHIIHINTTMPIQFSILGLNKP